MQAQIYEDRPVTVIDSGAAVILNSATRAVKAVLDRRAELDRAGQKDTPLVVLAGEDHSMPAYYMHHMLLIDGLSREDDLVVGLEYPHNQIEHGRAYDPERLARLKEDDSRGEISLTDACGFWFRAAADHSNVILARFLLRRDIATQFIDAAQVGPMLDCNDPSTLRSFKDCRRQVSSAVPAKSAAGEHVRNHHMAPMIVERALEAGARFIVVRSGANHVAGRYGEHEGRHSLSAEFRKLSLPLIGILPANFWLPPNHGLIGREILKMDKFPEIKAAYDAVDGRGRAAEADYINPLLEEAGLGHETMTPDEHAVFKAHCRKSLNALLPMGRVPL